MKITEKQKELLIKDLEAFGIENPTDADIEKYLETSTGQFVVADSVTKEVIESLKQIIEKLTIIVVAVDRKIEKLHSKISGILQNILNKLKNK